MLVVPKINSDEMTTALMESIRGSISGEATRPQQVDRNDLQHASNGQSGRGHSACTSCNAREQQWARILRAMRMLWCDSRRCVWDQLSLLQLVRAPSHVSVPFLVKACEKISDC